MVRLCKWSPLGLISYNLGGSITLCHHYGVELQHFLPNAITAAVVFAAMCEGYPGVMLHWDLWLHLYWG